MKRREGVDRWWPQRAAEPLPALDRWAAARWRRTLQIRWAGLGVIALAGGLIFTWPVAAVVLVGGGLANVLQSRHLARQRRLSPWLGAIDVFTTVAVIVVHPPALHAAAMILVSMVALASTTGATRPAMVGVAAGTASLVLLDLVGRTDGGGVPAIAFGISGLVVIVGVGALIDSERDLQTRLTGLVEDLDAVLWTRDPETHQVTYVTGRARGLLGFPTREWLRPGFWIERVHPDDRERVVGAVREAMADGRDHDMAYRMVHADGRIVHVHDRVTAIPGADGSTPELHGVTLDVTERHAIEQESRQYADIVEHSDLALIVARVEHLPGGAELRIVSANPASDAFLDAPSSEAVGSSVTELIPALARGGAARRLLDVARTGMPLRLDDLPIAHGTVHRTATLQAFVLPGDLVAISLQDTTEVTTATRALRRQALHDALTGLPNRAQLDELIRDEVPRAVADGRPLALLIMDLDQFKEVNDALGHAVGDRLLIAVSDRLRALLGTTFVARMGGDEFAIVMSGDGVDVAAAADTADTIARSLSAPFTLDDLRLQTNVSIGIALVPDHAADADELVRRADVAMYVAKRGGEGHAVYRPDQDHSSVARLTLIGDLRDAVPDGQLVLHYQPVLDLARGVVARTEALVRWQHPEHGLLPPDAFIGLAAVSGATQTIARWVLHEATRAAAAWQAAGHDVGVAINLSVRNLFDRDLIAEVERALAMSGLRPGDLVLELTESELMDDPSVALSQFRAFQEIGVGTSVDDFGTGYSSLTYLRDLPLTELKIDRSFIRDLHLRGGAYTIVRSMIDLGHNLGLEVVAEGVEHGGDIPTLARLGCDRAQGFHIARPMPEAELREWLLRRQGRPVAASPSSPAARPGPAAPVAGPLAAPLRGPGTGPAGGAVPAPVSARRAGM